jgi:hypothetical protein
VIAAMINKRHLFVYLILLYGIHSTLFGLFGCGLHFVNPALLKSIISMPHAEWYGLFWLLSTSTFWLISFLLFTGILCLVTSIAFFYSESWSVPTLRVIAYSVILGLIINNVILFFEPVFTMSERMMMTFVTSIVIALLHIGAQSIKKV